MQGCLPHQVDLVQTVAKVRGHVPQQQLKQDIVSTLCRQNEGRVAVSVGPTRVGPLLKQVLGTLPKNANLRLEKFYMYVIFVRDIYTMY